MARKRKPAIARPGAALDGYQPIAALEAVAQSIEARVLRAEATLGQRIQDLSDEVSKDVGSLHDDATRRLSDMAVELRDRTVETTDRFTELCGRLRAVESALATPAPPPMPPPPRPLFFVVKAPVGGGWHELFRSCGYGWWAAWWIAHGSHEARAVGVARTMMSDKWRGADVDGTICAITMPDGRVWRIAAPDGSRVTQLVPDTADYAAVKSHLGASAGFAG